MRIETYANSQLVESREAAGDEWIIRNGQGVETGREPLTDEEIARFAEEGRPTPDEALVADLQGATTIADLRDALVRRFGG